ncbi:DNA-binding response regulator, OmpR family, contains REC and winged-helix (wHTH) domain [Pedobacter suwonensis]|uniref:DNA-binding response regulator, OmpR family, contains REC and winged-helix (WHTH) domain n=1 Tax=Pedobacter suwonensis TaxID=332999 RepID=A0A1I0TIU5_9SPHI|nr:response regulator transcription factor [Pedobacter suwonensis]SFA51684.1 DNA-binding response regulator, OmpR family, contains REC and winged-helix (wHTH) domain [Pedobacter suwonensis]
MSRYKILLVEDEPFLAKVIEDSLLQKNYQVLHTTDGRKAYNLFLNGDVDLLILDVMLPSMDGFTFARQVRKVDGSTPILFLTAKTTTNDLIEGYKSGGNDYLKKPFSLDELFLRIEELLKRNRKELEVNSMEFSLGKYVFYPNKQILIYADETIKLSSRESELLLLLYKNKNSLTDRKLALISLWGDDNFFNTRTMDVFITKLRKHLKKDSSLEIINMRGLGYKLIC